VEGLEEKVNGGFFVDKNGSILGQHKGYPFYTIGQRKGLDIALGKPAYVTSIDPENNIVVLGEEEDLEKQEMNVAKINWIKYDSVDGEMEAVTKIRYKDPGTLSLVTASGTNASVVFYEKAKGIAPGQSAVFYEGNDVIGGGIIQRGS
jgi:tRNA-specific 2-thiouridylase